MREWLKEARLKAGYSQAELAKKLDISESYYFYIEDGVRQRNMDITLVTKLALFLNLTIQQIVEFETAWKEK